MEFCKKKGLILNVNHGKRGKPILKDYQDCVKEYLDESDEIRFRAEEIMFEYGVLCIRLPAYHPELNVIGVHIHFIVTFFSKNADIISV